MTKIQNFEVYVQKLEKLKKKSGKMKEYQEKVKNISSRKYVAYYIVDYYLKNLQNLWYSHSDGLSWRPLSCLQK